MCTGIKLHVQVLSSMNVWVWESFRCDMQVCTHTYLILWGFKKSVWVCVHVKKTGECEQSTFCKAAVWIINRWPVGAAVELRSRTVRQVCVCVRVCVCVKWLCVSLCVCVKWVCVSLCMCFVLLFLHSMRVQCEWVVQINTVGVFCVFRCEKQFSDNLRPPCYYEPLVCRLPSFLPTFPSVLLTEPCFFTSHFITPPHTRIFSTLTRSSFFSPPFLTTLSTFIGCIWCPVILHDLVTAIYCFFYVSLSIIGQKNPKHFSSHIRKRGVILHRKWKLTKQFPPLPAYAQRWLLC